MYLYSVIDRYPWLAFENTSRNMGLIDRKLNIRPIQRFDSNKVAPYSLEYFP